ncbi:unnamed protein product [Moneuplotes crassus]|uniref:Uncharacterized protein n=1 Tax=Euplotes crassus TaxID=5936 RepID=A0AAD1XGB8_EUPCR|nr:unnamed protein product [Moneuplotes crassus]
MIRIDKPNLPSIDRLNQTTTSQYRSASLYDPTPKFGICGKIGLRRTSNFTSQFRPRLVSAKRSPRKHSNIPLRSSKRVFITPKLLKNHNISMVVQNLEYRVKVLRSKKKICTSMGKRVKMTPEMEKLSIRESFPYKVLIKRDKLAAKVIQRWWRERKVTRQVVQRLRQRYKVKCAILVQRVWRGYICRKRLNEIKEAQLKQGRSVLGNVFSKFVLKFGMKKITNIKKIDILLGELDDHLKKYDEKVDPEIPKNAENSPKPDSKPDQPTNPKPTKTSKTQKRKSIWGSKVRPLKKKPIKRKPLYPSSKRSTKRVSGR